MWSTACGPQEDPRRLDSTACGPQTVGQGVRSPCVVHCVWHRRIPDGWDPLDSTACGPQTVGILWTGGEITVCSPLRVVPRRLGSSGQGMRAPRVVHRRMGSSGQGMSMDPQNPPDRDERLYYCLQGGWDLPNRDPR